MEQVRAFSLGEGKLRRETPYFLQPHLETGEFWSDSFYLVDKQFRDQLEIHRFTHSGILLSLKEIFWVVKYFRKVLFFFFWIVCQFLGHRFYLRYLRSHILHYLLRHLDGKLSIIIIGYYVNLFSREYMKSGHVVSPECIATHVVVDSLKTSEE